MVTKELGIDDKTDKTDKKSTYNKKFLSKIKSSEEDIKAGRITKIEPGDIWKL